MNVDEMEVGQFAERNGSIVYRYKNFVGKYYPWEDGILMVQQHPSVPISETLPEETIKNYIVKPPSRDYFRINSFVSWIEKPQKKHVDNTIKLLKDMSKDKKIDNLTFIENFNILKKYLKSDIVVTE